jgi:hypothetical protein
MALRGVVLSLVVSACSFEPARVDPPLDPMPQPGTPDAPEGGGGGGPITPAADASPGPASDAGGAPTEPTLYAHTDDRLYEIDLVDLTATLVGPFAFPAAETRQMTDVAIDQSGTLVGVSFDRVYTVGATTGNCLFLVTLDDYFNGLAFVPVGVMDVAKEILVGATNDGYLHTIDPASGVTLLVGEYGDGIESSGDLVYVPGRGLLATVIVDGSATDYLARINPATGRATVIGNTGFVDLWGLAYRSGFIYGFNPDGNLVKIDPATGAGSLFATASLEWYGAATAAASP